MVGNVTTGKGAVLLWLGLTAAGLGLCTGIVGGVLQGRAQALQQEGITGKATVVSSHSYLQTGGSSPAHEEYRIVLEIQGAGGRQVAWDVASRTVWQGYSRGDELDILYSPSDPENFVVGGDSRTEVLAQTARVAVWGGAGVFLLGMLLLVEARRRARL